jgi:hypothetical protein
MAQPSAQTGATPATRPTMLSSCARASTAAESRFRINAPRFPSRETRVIGLDQRSAAIVADLAGQFSGGSRFLVFDSALPDDALLRRASGAGDSGADGTALLSEELDGADTVVMIAAQGESAQAATSIGDAAAARDIMSVGLVVPADAVAEDGAAAAGAAAPEVNQVVAALRPNAMVLVVLRQLGDLPEVLSALRI